MTHLMPNPAGIFPQVLDFQTSGSLLTALRLSNGFQTIPAASSHRPAGFTGRGVSCIVFTFFASAVSFETWMLFPCAAVFAVKCGGGGLLGGTGFIFVTVFGLEFLVYIIRVDDGVVGDGVVGVGLDFEILMHLCSSRCFFAFALA